MRKVLRLLIVAVMSVPAVWAQEFDRINLGVYADYFRSNQTGTNMSGLGGRVGVKVFPHLKLEGEVSYDFNQVFAEGFTSTSGGTATFRDTGTRTLHGLLGPKLELGHSAFLPFLKLKGGFVNYSIDARSPELDTFVSSIQNVRARNINAALMPGGGLEGGGSARLDYGWMWVMKCTSTTERTTT